MNLYRYIILLLTAIIAVSCSFSSKLRDEDMVNVDVPMVFGTSLSQEETNVTKAPLETGFKVGTWKSFGLTQQEVVMDGYQVDYTASGSPYKWNYVGVNGQLQRYWDLGAFPYEFRAVSPCLSACNITAEGISMTGVSFQAQTFINETYNVTAAAGESAVVAHVQRRLESAEYADYDIIKNNEINSAAKSNAVREVQMPFHHLISKIGFRIFINDPQPSAPNYTVALKDVQISVENTDNNFITASTAYAATNAQGLISGTFTGNTTQTGAYTLLKHGEYTGVNLREHLNTTTAYDLCADFMQQIPQSNVKLRVKLTMISKDDNNVETTFEYNRLLSLDKTKTEGDSFTWAPDTKYIYYLHIPNLHEHTIYVNTCAILPWDEVQTEDISIGL